MIYITGANGWLGPNLVKSILQITAEWGWKRKDMCFHSEGNI